MILNLLDRLLPRNVPDLCRRHAQQAGARHQHSSPPAKPILSLFIALQTACAARSAASLASLNCCPCSCFTSATFHFVASLQTACAARSGLALRISTASNQLTHQACLDSVD